MRISQEQTRIAEKSVLAAAMLEAWAAQKALAMLPESDFTYPANRAIFGAMRRLERDGQPIDFITLSAEVEGDPAVNDYGGIDYLIELNSFIPSAANMEHYIAMVSEFGREARIVQEAARILKNEDPAIPQLEKLIERERAAMQQHGDGLQVLEDIEAFIIDLQNPDATRLIKTGFRSLDEKLGGLERGTVSCIAARPSAGKTALALNFLVSAIFHGQRAAFFSLEMSKRKILGRLGAALAKVNNDDVKRRRVTLEGIGSISTELVSLASGDRFILHDNVRSIAGIREEIARTEPGIIFVDYLQLVEAERSAESENYRLASIVQEFKRLARTYDCAICYLSQIGRAGDARPTMKDLYGSGAIEQASDLIIFLDRPFIRDRNMPPTQAEINIGKNKDGECGFVKLYFDGPHQLFTEADTRYEGRVNREGNTKPQREPGED